MLLDFIHERKKQLIIGIILVIAVVGVYAAGYFIEKVNNARSEEKVSEVLGALTYTIENNEREVANVKALLDEPALSESTYGLVCKSLVELTYLFASENEYSDYAGWGMFYLIENGNYNEAVLLASKYISRLYANGGYDAALLLLDNIAAKTNIDSLSDCKAKASYYLSYAYLQQMKGQYMEASRKLNKASVCIEEDSEDVYQALLCAQRDMLYVRMYIDREEYNTAAQYLSKYSESDTLGLSATNICLICDYFLPYYELNAKLALINNNLNEASVYIDKYLQYCENYNFRIMKVDMLEYVLMATENGIQNSITAKYRQMYDTEVGETISELSQNYTYTLLYNVEDASKQFMADKIEKRSNHRLSQIVLIVFLIAMAIYFTVSAMLYYSTLDGLTRLKNRKTYEKDHCALEKQKIVYYLLLLDIDNFKRVNDTYGHEFGDEVLRKIAAIMKKHARKIGCAYRYGGEELCIIMKSTDANACLDLAETIRDEIEHIKWVHDITITVSGGISASVDGHNPFGIADEYLYYSKQNGKNRITSRFTHSSSR